MFEQSPFKKEFVTMNKLLGANFVIDCRDDIDNFKFQPISDETGEISFIKKCTNEARKYSVNMKRAKSLDSLESLVFHKKKYNQKRTFSIWKIRSKTA